MLVVHRVPHQVELVRVVDAVLWQPLVSVEAVLAEVTVPVLVHGLRLLGVLHQTLHSVSHEGIGEHIRNDVKVFLHEVNLYFVLFTVLRHEYPHRSYIICSSQVVVSQLGGFPGGLYGGTLHGNVEQYSWCDD